MSEMSDWLQRRREQDALERWHRDIEDRPTQIEDRLKSITLTLAELVKR
jgi:hypothetical protein